MASTFGNSERGVVWPRVWRRDYETHPVRRRGSRYSRPWMPIAVTSLSLALMAADARAQFTLISETADHTPANGRSGSAVISGNGRYVAFASEATNLVAGDTNTSWDIFVKDRQTGSITRISVASDGTERNGDSGLFGFDISHDGQVIAFASFAALAADDTNRCDVAAPNDCQDIYVHDRATGQTTRVNVARDGSQADQGAQAPSLSPDGRYVAFVSAATTLVANDTNGETDVFVHDRVNHTMTRVSMSSDGVQSDGPSSHPAVANDGVVVFVSSGTTLSDEPDSLPCQLPPMVCGRQRAYVHTLVTGATERVLVEAVPGDPTVLSVDIDASGRWIALHIISRLRLEGHSRPRHIRLYDRASRRTTLVSDDISGPGLLGLPPSISGNGRMVWTHTEPSPTSHLFDRITGLHTAPRIRSFYSPNLPAFTWSFDGLTAAFSTREDFRVYVYSRDADGDSMADDWEATFGFDPSSAADGALDSDGDGRTTQQEYEAGSHPRGTQRRYLAEGAVNAFFSTRLALLNTGTAPTSVVLRFLGPDGATSSITETVPGRAHKTVILDAISNVPSGDFSTIIESAVPLVVERTMTWDGAAFGGHAERAIEMPWKTWYLAEGSTAGPFDLFYLLQNPQTTSVDATIRFVRPSGLPPIEKTYRLAPLSRTTIAVDAVDAALASTDVGAVVTATAPIVVERAMYLSRPGEPFAAGHSGAGNAAPYTEWLFAEGATGAFFDTFLLLLNPTNQQAACEVIYLTAAGPVYVKNYTLDPESRTTIWVDQEEIPGQGRVLADVAVAMWVRSLNGIPIVAERAMWWPEGDWREAHMSAGVLQPGRQWALADGEVGGPHAAETYVLIANMGDDGDVNVTLLFEDGSAASKAFTMTYNSRLNVPIGQEFPDASGRRFAILVESVGLRPNLVVERSTYWNANGIVWGAGTNVPGTRVLWR
jgi:hypothetical protein